MAAARRSFAREFVGLSMPREQEEFREGVEEILQAVMFENWLRFYFLSEEKDDAGEPVLRMDLPDKSLVKIHELYPALYQLAEKLNHKVVDFETSRSAVLSWVLDNLDGKKLPTGMTRMVLESLAFQLRLQMFHAWVQLHEDQLDQRFMDFGAWQKLFEEWAKSPAAIEFAARLANAPQSSQEEA